MKETWVEMVEGSKFVNPICFRSFKSDLSCFEVRRVRLRVEPFLWDFMLKLFETINLKC